MREKNNFAPILEKVNEGAEKNQNSWNNISFYLLFFGNWHIQYVRWAEKHVFFLNWRC